MTRPTSQPSKTELRHVLLIALRLIEKWSDPDDPEPHPVELTIRKALRIESSERFVGDSILLKRGVLTPHRRPVP